MEYRFLNEIKSPSDLKKLDSEDIKLLCDEIRDKLLYVVSHNGGHLASNLGVVELTVALHRAFESPKDAIIFDVGHQCYTHKLLTGRYESIETIRKQDGISGFMRPSESEHDQFVTGHASNSIAAAFGIYKAKQIKGEDGTAVAVIGDGALTGGLAFEALNNIGTHKGNFIVVVNDNEMSISVNVGSLSKHLNKIRLKPAYHKLKSETESFLLKLTFIGIFIHKILSKIKGFFKRIIYKDNLFEALGFNYIGPVDGHNIEKLNTAFSIAKLQTSPCVVHVITKKGKGYEFAEKEPDSYHGVSAFNADEGILSSANDNFSSIAGKALAELAKEDDKICAITAAMPNGTGLDNFAAEYPDRFFDVGIAEEYAVTFSAGLASGGVKPYFAVYSSFLQRAYDQIIHDTAIQGLPLRLLVDRAGIVGEDGETHQGVFDAAFLSAVPNMTIYSPASYSELEGYIALSKDFTSPVAIRYPRGKEIIDFKFSKKDFTVFKTGGRTAIVTYGLNTAEAIFAQQKLKEENILVDVIKLNKIFPISQKLIDTLNEYERLEFFEEGIKKGGIFEHIAGRVSVNYRNVTAIDDKFIPAMTRSAALKYCRLDRDSIIKIVKGEK